MKQKVCIILCILLIAAGCGLGLYGWPAVSAAAIPHAEVLPICGKIAIDATSCDMVIQPSEDGQCHLRSWESEGSIWTAVVEDGVLRIREQSTKPWFAALTRITVGTDPLILELPSGSCNALQVDCTSGDVLLSGVTADVIAARSTSGNVTLQDCDAGDIAVDCTSGNVTARLRTGKTFTVHAASGDVTIPPDQPEGGTCRIGTTSGNVIVTVG